MTASDISDVLNPVLVKELRQGLKSRAFGFTFMLMQGLMAVSVAIQVLAAADSHDDVPISIFFWFCAGAPLLILLPLRSIGAIYNEHRQNTFSLVLLTNLTPWRIVLGKWTSLMAQALLIACAVLPYAVLRYYLGGVDVAIDLLVLALIVGACAFLCAGGLLISTVKHPWRAVGIGSPLAVVFSPLLIAIVLPFGLVIYAMSGRPGLIPAQLFLAAGALLHFASCRYANTRFNEKSDGRIAAFISLALLIGCIQGAAKFSAVYSGLPLLLPPAAAFFHRGLVLALPGAGRRRLLGLSTVTFLLLVFAMMLVHPLPGLGRLHFFATLTTACALPWLVMFRLWSTPSLYYFFQFIVLLICGVFLFAHTDNLASIPAIMQALPIFSFIICVINKADPAFLNINLAIAALTLLALARTAFAPRRSEHEKSAHAIVA